MAENYSQGAGQNGKKPLSNGWKVFLIVVLAILVISPLDIVPGDLMTGIGLADDVAYIVGIVGTIASMVKGKSAQNASNPPMYNDVDSNKKPGE